MIPRAGAPRSAPEGPTSSLSTDEVHVWRASLDPPGEVVEALGSLLDEDERKRADRFAFEEHRRRFTVGRGLLRAILGHYSAIEPARIRFAYNPFGKPALAPGQRDVSLRFNLSHSGGVALYAVALGREVGVDIEVIRPEFAGQAIAERFFAPAEVATLLGLRPELRTRAFFSCWTRKEAYIKARGKGLAIPLDTFEVSLHPEAPPEILATHDIPDEAGRWTLFALDPGEGYVGALAVEGGGCRLRYETWPGIEGPSTGPATPARRDPAR